MGGGKGGPVQRGLSFSRIFLRGGGGGHFFGGGESLLRRTVIQLITLTWAYDDRAFMFGLIFHDVGY